LLIANEMLYRFELSVVGVTKCSIQAGNKTSNDSLGIIEKLPE